MKSILQLPIARKLSARIHNLHARGRLVPAIVVLVVAAVLVHGALTRKTGEEAPRRAEQFPALIELPALRPDLEKTQLAYASDYWRQLGKKVQNKLVLIGRRRIPGVVVAPGVALTSISAADDVVAEQREQEAMREGTAQQEGTDAEADGQAAEAGTEADPVKGPYELLGVDSELGLALFAIKQDDAEASFRQSEYSVVPPGANVAAVSFTPDKGIGIAPGYVTSLSRGALIPVDETRLEVAIPFPESLQVAAIVDLDARLAGIAFQSSEGMQVLSSDAVGLIVERLAGGPLCQAIEVGELSGEARTVLGLTGGVVVEKVRRDAFAPEPSIHEGDILLSWNRRNVASVEEFGGLYREPEPGSLVRYVVLRNRRRISGATRTPGPDCRVVGEPLHVHRALGVTLQWEQSSPGDERQGLGGWKVVMVIENTPAAQGALEPGDAIIGVDGREFDARDRTMFQRFERSPRPMVLSVRRGDRVKLLAVPAQVEPPAPPSPAPAASETDSPPASPPPTG